MFSVMVTGMGGSFNVIALNIIVYLSVAPEVWAGC